VPSIEPTTNTPYCHYHKLKLAIALSREALSVLLRHRQQPLLLFLLAGIACLMFTATAQANVIPLGFRVRGKQVACVGSLAFLVTGKGQVTKDIRNVELVRFDESYIGRISRYEKGCQETFKEAQIL